MPTDILLATNSPTGTLELRQAQRLPDGKLFATFLIVRSGAFAAAVPYFVTRVALAEFVDALDRMRRGAGSAARLPASESDGFLAMELDASRSIAVSGELHEGREQTLRFRFVTAPGAVEELQRGLRELLDGQPE